MANVPGERPVRESRKPTGGIGRGLPRDHQGGWLCVPLDKTTVRIEQRAHVLSRLERPEEKHVAVAWQIRMTP
jgi:hypothetical protein